MNLWLLNVAEVIPQLFFKPLLIRDLSPAFINLIDIELQMYELVLDVLAVTLDRSLDVLEQVPEIYHAELVGAKGVVLLLEKQDLYQ